MKRSVFLTCRGFSCCCPAYLNFCLPICLSDFLWWLLFVCQSSWTSVYWSVCLFASLSSAAIFLLQSLLPVLSVAILPNSISACQLACLSFFHAADLHVAALLNFISACHLACLTFCDDSCLSVSHPERPSIGLSVFLPACPLLPSFCYIPPTCLDCCFPA